MKEFLLALNWNEVITTLWTVILLPVLTYVAAEINKWAKEKKIDKYTNILQNSAVAAVKDVYETVVKNIKGTESWTDDKQKEVKEIAKQKALNALTNTAYQILKTANTDFDDMLDSYIETALYDLKNK